MQIHGFAKLTLLDYPGRIAATVFTGGCNFRCPFCHNAVLVLDPNAQPRIDENEILRELESRKNKLEDTPWLLKLGIISVPLVYICSQAGWMVAEVGRQPWTIQDLLPVNAAVSGVAASNVATTFIIFAVLFTATLVIELRIMFTQIKKGA